MPSTGKPKSNMPKNGSRKVQSRKQDHDRGDKQLTLLTSTKKLRDVGQSNSSPHSGGSPSSDTASGKENRPPVKKGEEHPPREYPRDPVSNPT